VASDRTRLTELATAVGLFYEPSEVELADLGEIEVPGVDEAIWKPAVLPAAAVGANRRDLLLRALDNGRTFRLVVLRGRFPERVEWLGGSRSVWASDVPRDLTVDGVWFIQAKYDSTCVLNTSPSAMFDHLLAEEPAVVRESWFSAVAPRELQRYYDAVRTTVDGGDLEVPLPADVRDLGPEARATVKAAMRSGSGVEPTVSEARAYAELTEAVSAATARRWQRNLASTTAPQRTQMLFRMLRIAGGPYWLLGTKGSAPVRLAVCDTRSWRERFTLGRFSVADPHAGQPQVDWRADVTDRASGEVHRVEGFCEVRWSHGKLQGMPECKVQVRTPLADLPGYDPIS
jgi:hypothetical protein